MINSSCMSPLSNIKIESRKWISIDEITYHDHNVGSMMLLDTRCAISIAVAVLPRPARSGTNHEIVWSSGLSISYGRFYWRAFLRVDLVLVDEYISAVRNKIHTVPKNNIIKEDHHTNAPYCFFETMHGMENIIETTNFKFSRNLSERFAWMCAHVATACAIEYRFWWDNDRTTDSFIVGYHSGWRTHTHICWKSKGCSSIQCVCMVQRGTITRWWEARRSTPSTE
jgi:hypothetical protein